MLGINPSLGGWGGCPEKPLDPWRCPWPGWMGFEAAWDSGKYSSFHSRQTLGEVQPEEWIWELGILSVASGMAPACSVMGLITPSSHSKG